MVAAFHKNSRNAVRPMALIVKSCPFVVACVAFGAQNAKDTMLPVFEGFAFTFVIITSVSSP